MQIVLFSYGCLFNFVILLGNKCMTLQKNKKVVGLALGSGAFRGLAHIGVIQFLQENKISIGAISGSSIGALAAAYFAIYQEIDSLQAKILLEKDRKFKLSDFSLRGGLVSSKKFESFINYLLGGYNFNDTKIPLRILATDLASGLPVVFSDGSLAAAVCASSAVPLVFEPAKRNQQRFIDGALSSPVPVCALRDAGLEKIIAVNLYHQNEFNNKKFTFTNVALRSARIALFNLARHDVKEADVVLSPDISAYVKTIGNFGMRQYLSTNIANKIINIGKEEAEKHLTDILNLLKK